ncbi:hypothetical protein CRENBAI_019310 [Crenichthys baileyi]|uniref:Uncharacterized protein n=1 Tax=Crenichthys baileyi TaxID=28760 RepID=A0AAV9QZT1_9TELE
MRSRRRSQADGSDLGVDNLGQLILEVIANPDLPLEDMPTLPRKGVLELQAILLHHQFRRLGQQWSQTQAKVGEFIVTSEAWHRDRVLQIPGTVLHWTDTPLTLAPPRRYDWQCKWFEFHIEVYTPSEQP